MKKVVVSLGVIFSLYIVTVVFLGVVAIKQTDNTSLDYNNYRFRIPVDLNFCGEQAPIHDIEFRKKLDKQLYNYSHIKSGNYLLHKRANAYLKRIARILKQNKLPEDLKYIAIVESQFLNKRSRKGAAGYWQFMPHTAQDYGLIFNANVDERLNIESSTLAACKFFKETYVVLKNWTLVAAAYNSGLGNIQKRIKKQNEKEYYSLDLSKETEQYMIRVLAMKEIFEHPKEYGYNFKKSDLYQPIDYKILEIDSGITDLKAFVALQCKDDYCFRVLNPWILSNEALIPDSGKKFKFLIPIETESNLNQIRLFAKNDSINGN